MNDRNLFDIVYSSDYSLHGPEKIDEAFSLDRKMSALKDKYGKTIAYYFFFLGGISVNGFSHISAKIQKIYRYFTGFGIKFVRSKCYVFIYL